MRSIAPATHNWVATAAVKVRLNPRRENLDADHGSSELDGRLEAMSLDAGTKLGPYQIVSPLGACGMGEVYRARDRRLGRDVAVKILPASYSAYKQGLQRRYNTWTYEVRSGCAA